MARFRRIGRLPVPLARRAQVTGASAISASLYGVGQQHIGDTRLARLRGANLAAVWRTPFRAIPELVFAALTLPWRADVLAVAVVQPWWFLCGLLARQEAAAPDIAKIAFRGSCPVCQLVPLPCFVCTCRLHFYYCATYLKVVWSDCRNKDKQSWKNVPLAS